MGETQHTSRMEPPRDEEGFLLRECPAAECEKLFKVKPGTGLTGPDLNCTCPYCGHEGAANTFHTKDQVKHVESVVYRAFDDYLYDTFKGMEFSTSGPLSISMEVTRHGHAPIHPISNLELEPNLLP